jgi:DNA-binding response OmpR family regulator
MTGVEAAEKLRQEAHKVPIIFISALSDVKTQDRIDAISNSALVCKPFDHLELVQTINSFLN